MFQLTNDCLHSVWLIVKVLKQYSEKQLKEISEAIWYHLKEKLGYGPPVAIDEAHVLYGHLSGCENDQGAEADEETQAHRVKGARSLFSLLIEEVAHFVKENALLLLAGTALSLSNLGDIDSSVAKTEAMVQKVCDFPYFGEERIMDIFDTFLVDLPDPLCRKLAAEMAGLFGLKLPFLYSN